MLEVEYMLTNLGFGIWAKEALKDYRTQWLICWKVNSML